MNRTRSHRVVVALAAAGLAMGVTAAPALACGGLVAPNGAVRLLRTSTLAAYHDGVEHYVTSFQFTGGADPGAPADGPSEFGSIVPLPGVPTSVERGGDWTLQRLAREVAPVEAATDTARKSTTTAAPAEVLLQTRIDALDITVLRGGGTAVGDWARQHGFLLTPDAPAMLDFYARRSPIFLAARFDATAARQQHLVTGDGTPIHITIPVDNPWVPLHILSLGRGPTEVVDADVFLLTDRKPALLPAPGNGMQLERDEPATPNLLRDLRADKGMEWMPDQMWLSYLRIDAPARDLVHDLAIDTSGHNRPSPVLAGLQLAAISHPVGTDDRGDDGTGVTTLVLALSTLAAIVVGAVGVAVWDARRTS